MGIRRILAQAQGKIDALLGDRHLAMGQHGDRQVVLQIVEAEGEVDLDVMIDGNPLIARRIEEGLRAAEGGDTFDHAEVVQANVRQP